jgi:hypothetical protein
MTAVWLAERAVEASLAKEPSVAVEVDMIVFSFLALAPVEC